MKFKESYCPFDVARLLNESSFDCEEDSINAMYKDDGSLVHLKTYKGDISDSFIVAPTQSLALAWLRERGYSVEVSIIDGRWSWNVYNIPDGDCIIGGTPSYDYEECVNDAIRYMLTEVL